MTLTINGAVKSTGKSKRGTDKVELEPMTALVNGRMMKIYVSAYAIDGGEVKHLVKGGVVQTAPVLPPEPKTELLIKAKAPRVVKPTPTVTPIADEFEARVAKAMAKMLPAIVAAVKG